MRYFRNFIILTLCTVVISAVFSLRFFLYRNDKNIPRIETAQTIDGKKYINVYVTLPQIKKEIAPIAIEEFLSQTKIANTGKGGLELVDFKDDGVLTRYGFEKGDIVKEINGQKLNSTEEAIRLCEVLEKKIFESKDAKEINVILNRNGEDINMNFKIPEFVPEKVYYTMCLEKRAGR